MKRVNPSKKMRFEVLKRDSFKCQYCGASAPDVPLHIDHIHPVSKGGKTTLLNLVTSCADCNGGKSARLLSDASAINASKKQADEIAQQRLDLEMMLKWRAGLVDLDERKMDEIQKILRVSGGINLSEQGVSVIKKLLKKHSFADMLEGLEIATSQYEGSNIVDKLGGILASRQEDKENPGMARIRHATAILRKSWGYKWQPYYFREIIEATKPLLKSYEAGSLFTAIKRCSSIDEVHTLISSLDAKSKEATR